MPTTIITTTSLHPSLLYQHQKHDQTIVQLNSPSLSLTRLPDKDAATAAAVDDVYLCLWILSSHSHCEY